MTPNGNIDHTPIATYIPIRSCNVATPNNRAIVLGCKKKKKKKITT